MMYRGDYLLVKVGLEADKDKWFGFRIPDGEGRGYGGSPEDGKEDIGVKGNREKRGFFRRFFSGENKSRQSRPQPTQYEMALQYLDTELRSFSASLQNAVYDLDGGMNPYSVYEDSLEFLTLEDGMLATLWQQNWGCREFTSYTLPRWTLPLVRELPGPDFILLGVEAAIPEILEYCAPGMRSLTWVITDSEDSEEMQDYIEYFYEEYGLAIGTQVCEKQIVFKTVARPVCVLDFAGEKLTLEGALPAGSNWVDFSSDEKKELHLHRISPDTHYISLKKYWRECRRKQADIRLFLT